MYTDKPRHPVHTHPTVGWSVGPNPRPCPTSTQQTAFPLSAHPTETHESGERTSRLQPPSSSSNGIFHCGKKCSLIVALRKFPAKSKYFRRGESENCAFNIRKALKWMKCPQ